MHNYVLRCYKESVTVPRSQHLIPQQANKRVRRTLHDIMLFFSAYSSWDCELVEIEWQIREKSILIGFSPCGTVLAVDSEGTGDGAHNFSPYTRSSWTRCFNASRVRRSAVTGSIRRRVKHRFNVVTISTRVTLGRNFHENRAAAHNTTPGSVIWVETSSGYRINNGRLRCSSFDSMSLHWPQIRTHWAMCIIQKSQK